jgi:predicted GIY-YIG superfamily endonuclease
MKWTKELCIESAKKCKNRSDFKINYSGAFSATKKNGWIEEVNKYLPKHQKKQWTKELCHKEALRYNYRVKFEKKSHKAYDAARRNNWLDEICSHMEYLIKPSGYWNNFNCINEALKYNNKTEWHKNSPSSYNAARKDSDLYNECTEHMNNIGSKYERLVYKYTFQDKSIYIGITCNKKTRKKDHYNNINSPVYNHIKLTNTLPKYVELSDYINYVDAINIEIKLIEIYKKNKEWNLLNKQKGGGLGSERYNYTKELCHKEALKYNYRSEFKKNANRFYVSSRKRGWLDDICSHMKYKQKPNGYWSNNKLKCFNEGIRYKNINQFKLNSAGAYNAIIKNKLYNEFKYFKIVYNEKIGK